MHRAAQPVPLPPAPSDHTAAILQQFSRLAHATPEHVRSSLVDSVARIPRHPAEDRLSGRAYGADRELGTRIARGPEPGRGAGHESDLITSGRWTCLTLAGREFTVRAEVRDTRLQKHWDTLETNTDGEISRSGFSSFIDDNLSNEELEELVKNHDEAAKPIESWFTGPEHKPEGDD